MTSLESLDPAMLEAKTHRVFPGYRSQEAPLLIYQYEQYHNPKSID